MSVADAVIADLDLPHRPFQTESVRETGCDSVLGNESVSETEKTLEAQWG